MKLRFWFRQGMEITGGILGGSLLYGLLMFIQMGSGWEDLLQSMPVFLLLFGALMMMASVIGIHKLSLHLALSFGSTRNEALLGLQIDRLLPTLLVPALAAILTAVAGENAIFPPMEVFLLGVGAFLCTGALGTAAGVVFAKYGRAATVITMILLLLLSGGIGVLIGVSAGGDRLLKIMNDGKAGLLVLGIGVLLYSLAMIPEQRTVWKCSVKL